MTESRSIRSKATRQEALSLLLSNEEFCDLRGIAGNPSVVADCAERLEIRNPSEEARICHWLDYCAGLILVRQRVDLIEDGGVPAC